MGKGKNDLKKQFDRLNGEIYWKEEVIERSLGIDYGQTTKLKKEIEDLKKQRVLLIKEIENREKQKTLIKSRSKLKTIKFRSGGRTKNL